MSKSKPKAEAVNEMPLPAKGSENPAWKQMGVIFGAPIEDDSKLFRHATLPPGWTKKPTDHYMYSDLLDEKGRKRAVVGYKGAMWDRWAAIYPVSRFDIQRVYHPRKPAPPPREIKTGKKRFVQYTEKEIHDQQKIAHRNMDMYGHWHAPDFLVRTGYWEEIVEYEHFPAPPCEDDTSVTFRVLDSGEEVFRSKTVTITDYKSDSRQHYQDLEAAEVACKNECQDWLFSKGFNNWHDVASHWD